MHFFLLRQKCARYLLVLLSLFQFFSRSYFIFLCRLLKRYKKGNKNNIRILIFGNQTKKNTQNKYIKYPKKITHVSPGVSSTKLKMKNEQKKQNNVDWTFFIIWGWADFSFETLLYWFEKFGSHWRNENRNRFVILYAGQKKLSAPTFRKQNNRKKSKRLTTLVLCEQKYSKKYTHKYTRTCTEYFLKKQNTLFSPTM